MLQNHLRGEKLIAYILLFSAIAFLKTPNLFLSPRFWAEESSAYADMQGASAIRVLTRFQLENIPLVTNFASYLAALAPLQFAPAVTSAIAFLFMLVVAIQIALFVKDYNLGDVVGILLLVAVAYAPPSYEIWMTSTNTQWWAGVSVLLLATRPSTAFAGWRLPLACAWLILCGASGIAGAVPAVALLIRWLQLRDRVSFLLCLCLGTTAAYQAAFILLNPIPRSYSGNAIILTAPTIIQSMLAPLFGVEFAAAVGEKALKSNLLNATMLGIYLAGAVIFAAAVCFAMSSPYRPVAVLIAATWMVVSVVQTFGGLGDASHLLKPVLGARYFFLGCCCLCLLLALGTVSRHAAVSTACVGALLAICVTGIVYRYSGQVSMFLHGPSWRTQAAACSLQGCSIKVWPEWWHAVNIRR